MKTFEQAVEKVVNFWVEKSFNSPLNQNNGDRSQNGGIAFLLMNMLSQSAQSKVTPEQIEAFREKLTTIITSKQNYSTITLSVDYSPCEELSQACEIAGINVSCLPCKTVTWLDTRSNTAKAKYTYGGQVYNL